MEGGVDLGGWLVTYRDGLPVCQQTVTHPSSNWTWCRATALTETTSQRHHATASATAADFAATSTTTTTLSQKKSMSLHLWR